jgi:integrase
VKFQQSYTTGWSGTITVSGSSLLLPVQAQGGRTGSTAVTQAYATSGYMVADELGAAASPEWFTDEFHRVAALAGVPRIRLHDGRHTVNSLMATAGVPDHIRAAWCGHTVAVNVATYTHARPEDLAAAALVLSKIHNAV